MTGQNVDSVPFFSVQKKYCKVEISRKRNPKNIRNLENTRNRFDSVKFYYHNKNHNPQHNKPDERKKECTHIEKDDAPEEVQEQINAVNGQCTFDFIGFFFFFVIDHSGTYAHQYVKYSPYYREKNRRRCKSGLCYFGI